MLVRLSLPMTRNSCNADRMPLSQLNWTTGVSGQFMPDLTLPDIWRKQSRPGHQLVPMFSPDYLVM